MAFFVFLATNGKMIINKKYVIIKYKPFGMRLNGTVPETPDFWSRLGHTDTWPQLLQYVER